MNDEQGPGAYRKKETGRITAMRVPHPSDSPVVYLHDSVVLDWLEGTLGDGLNIEKDLPDVEAGWGRDHDTGAVLLVSRARGVEIAQPGDWIIRDERGTFYPTSPPDFDANYEPDTEN